MTRHLLAIATLAIAGLSATGPAVSATWTPGVHYSVIPTQRTNVPAGKVEVMEVFSYGCPACNQFRPVMKKLKAALPPNAQLVYLPASWMAQEDWPMFQRAYLTAQSLGIAEKAHETMYDAIWTTGELGISDKSTNKLKTRLPTIDDAAKFYARVAGVKPADFVSASKSFGVELKMRQADRQITEMQVPSTPTLVVNGKYRLNNDRLQTNEEFIDLVKFLVAKETPAAPAAALSSTPAKAPVKAPVKAAAPAKKP